MGDTDVDTMANVTIGKYNFKDDAFKEVSDNAKDFIKSLLLKDGEYVYIVYCYCCTLINYWIFHICVFNRSRLKACDVLKHPWLINSAKNTELTVTKTKLKRYVIKKRWIKAVNTIIALRRMGAKIDFSLI